jgi:hypothetical protein
MRRPYFLVLLLAFTYVSGQVHVRIVQKEQEEVGTLFFYRGGNDYIYYKIIPKIFWLCKRFLCSGDINIPRV